MLGKNISPLTSLMGVKLRIEFHVLLLVMSELFFLRALTRLNVAVCNMAKNMLTSSLSSNPKMRIKTVWDQFLDRVKR